MIERMKIKNFMAFSEEVTVNFSPKVNVIIGENGTGKSQLLKLIHAFHVREKLPSGDLEKASLLYAASLLDYFIPFDDNIEELSHHGAKQCARVEVSFDGEIYFLALNNAQLEARISNDVSSTFIPAKEVLSFMEGFVSMYEKYKLSFDKTYRDISLDLDHPVLRANTLHETSKASIERIEELCGGKFIFHGGGKVTFKTFNDDELSVNAVAEGYRKIGMLARLLKTGAINFETSGPLLWDEPEANMNPNIMQLLVEILLEISRNGQQIILTTHDYVLLKWFDLLMDKERGDEVRFHHITRDANGVINVRSFDEYKHISHSSILDTFAELMDADIRRALGGSDGDV